MKRALLLILMFVWVLTLAGCGEEKPAGKEAPKQNETVANSKTFSEAANGPRDDALSLPDGYPKEMLPLAADAEILGIRENPANNGLEVDYVSGNNLDTLVDYYEGALKDAKDLSSFQTQSGHMVTASMDGTYYTIMLSEGILDHIPNYAGKVAVSIVLSGLQDISSSRLKLPDEGQPWPSAKLPGVPRVKGYIVQVQEEDDIVRLEITVENADVVRSYIGALMAAGFSFDTEPNAENDHMEFLAFKDSGIMNFAYKGEEQLVFIEYQ